MPRRLRSNSLGGTTLRTDRGTHQGATHDLHDGEPSPDLDVGTHPSLPALRRDARGRLPRGGQRDDRRRAGAGLARRGCWAWPAPCPTCDDTLRRTTVPHRGTWFIWGLLEVVALEAQRADGARWSLLPLLTQTIGTCLVFGRLHAARKRSAHPARPFVDRPGGRRGRGVARGRRTCHRHGLRHRGRLRGRADDDAQDLVRPALGDVVHLRARSRLQVLLMIGAVGKMSMCLLALSRRNSPPVNAAVAGGDRPTAHGSSGSVSTPDMCGGRLSPSGCPQQT